MSKEIPMPRAAIVNMTKERLWQVCDILSDTMIDIDKYMEPTDDRLLALKETLGGLYTLSFNTAQHAEDVDNMGDKI